MENMKYFLEIIDNLDESIKKQVRKMGFPYILTIHIDKTKNIGEEINKLLKDIEKKIPRTFGDSIPYILGKLTDNIEQHSDYFNAFVFINYNLIERIIEIGVFDDGLSIPFVFEKNKIQFHKDNGAIKMALEGTTTKKEDISRRFGLKTIKEIISVLKGNMQIISRKGILKVENSNVGGYDFKGQLKGTLIYIKLRAPEKDLNIYPYLG